MFAPSAPALVIEFAITDDMVASLTVSIYLLSFAVGPLLISSMSEMYGRLIIYHLCNLFYLGFTVGCALSSNTAMFLVFRFLCGCAASSPMSIGGGTIADLYEADERGKAMALFGLGPLLGPVSRMTAPFPFAAVYGFLTSSQVIGPVIGGFVGQDLGWRWTFWIILIFVSARISGINSTSISIILLTSLVCTGRSGLMPRPCGHARNL